MSNTIVADTSEDSKSDSTLIIIVNNDGTISVDQETLRNLLANQQSNRPVNVVRVGDGAQGDDSQDSSETSDSQNDGNPHITLTVDGYYPPKEQQEHEQSEPSVQSEQPPPPAAESVTEPLVDTFLEMDPEQLQRLETALQSEQAKEILGENVTAMLDMLSVDEETNQHKDSVRLDHCYTNLSPSSAPPSKSSSVFSANGDSSSPEHLSDSFESDHPSPAIPTPPARTRGRGRGPGRPRRDACTTRGSSYRGRGRASRGAANNLIVQQVKQIVPGLNQPSATATLVPLIKPLVVVTQPGGVATLIKGAAFQKQVVTVPVSASGARVVTLPARSGPVVSSSQHKIVLSSNTLSQLQQRNSELETARSNNVPITAAELVSNTSTNLTQPKVVVTKISPSLPQSLIDSSVEVPSTSNDKKSEENVQESCTEFSRFPYNDDSDDSNSSIQGVSDDDYKDSVNRRRGRGAKSRGGRLGRGARTRGFGRQLDNTRGTFTRGVRRRGGGRGRGAVKIEEIEHVRKLEDEMSVALMEMSKSPQKTVIKEEKAELIDAAVANIKVEPLPGGCKEPLRQSTDNEEELVSDQKKAVKVYGRNLGKKRVESVIPQERVELQEVKKEDSRTSHADAEKKHTPKVLTKLSSEASADSTTPPPPPTPEVKSDSRKNYPKRENRKPPAHLAEAFGPALFSTPDVIRRVSTSSEPKTPSAENPSEPNKKDNHLLRHDVKNNGNLAMQDISSSSIKSKEDNSKNNLSSTDGNTSVEAPVAVSCKKPTTEKEPLTTLDSLLPERQSEDKISDTNQENEDPSTKAGKAAFTSGSKIVSSTDVINPKSDCHLSSSNSNFLEDQKPASPTKTEPFKSVGSRGRRRNSNQQINQSDKRPAQKSSPQKPSGNTQKEKSKLEGRVSRGKGRRRSSEVDLPDDDDEEQQTSSDESWNSEDDPDRLWCICKKPHNNRFMICCDICGDWFHGKCVGVTKAMGKQMEKKGIEWRCPDCSKKKDLEMKEKDLKQSKTSSKEEDSNKADKEPEKSIDSTGEPMDEEHTASEKETQQTSSGNIMFCIVCKKEARQSSIYCSDGCILKHAQESLNVVAKDKTTSTKQQQQTTQQSKQTEQSKLIITPSGSVQLLKARPDARVVVIERKSGKVLTGTNAPTAGNLKSWLKENPTFEVLRPANLSVTKPIAKKSQSVDGKSLAQPKSPMIQTKLIAIEAKTAQNMQTSQKIISIQHKSVPNAQSTSSPTKLSQTIKADQNQSKNSAIPNKPPTPVISSKSSSKPVATKQIVSPDNSNKTGLNLSTGLNTKPIPGKVVKQASAQEPPSNSKISPVPINKNLPSNGKLSVKATTNQPSSNNNKTLQTTVVSKATSTVKEPSNKVPDKTEKPKKVEIKRISSTDVSKTENDKEKEQQSEPKPIRLTVRKALQELLLLRIQECPDLSVSEEEVQNIALSIEEEMHECFKDTGHKYKSKYRSLVFNIKDPKNLTLFRKIAEKLVTPHQLVRMSPEELASQELAEWREREAKHQLEMIKKNELDLMTLGKTYVMKTHKGEQVIETDEPMKVEVPELVDPSSEPVLLSPVNNSVTSTVEDTALEAEKDKSKLKGEVKDKDKVKKEEKDRSHEKSKSKYDEKKKDKDKTDKSKKEVKESSKRESRHKSRHSDRDRRHSSERSKDRSRHRSSDKKDKEERNRDSNGNHKEKREELNAKEESVVEQECVSTYSGEDDYLNRTNKWKEEKSEQLLSNDDNVSIKTDNKLEPHSDSDASDHEPSSTVTIKTPDINTENIDPMLYATVWKGYVNMPDVAKFFTTVQVVSGDAQNLCNDLPDTVDIVGRIVPETVWDYILKMKKTGTKEILVIRLTAANDEEKIPYITLYTYLNTRKRLGVVGNVSKMIKDFYIMPLASHKPLPTVLLPLDGPGFEDRRPHLLLGILVRSIRKRHAPENEYVAKVPKRVLGSNKNDSQERSYTPPLPDAAGSLTPPHPPPSSSGSYTPPLSPHRTNFPGTNANSSNIESTRKWVEAENDSDSENMLDELTSPSYIKHEKSYAGTILKSKTIGPYTVDEDDEDDTNDENAPYSPGESDDLDIPCEDDDMITSSKTSDLQRKMDELNRRIEKEKQQIENISSAIVTDSVASTLETLQVQPGMHSFMVRPTDRCNRDNEREDEFEAYSPSRSFTPPASNSTYESAVDPAMSNVLSTLPSNISIPSNLQEILASITMREADASSHKGINLKSDPIVQNYRTTLQEGDKNVDDLNFATIASSAHQTFMSNAGQNSSLASFIQGRKSPGLQSASSALLSLATPVVHPLGGRDPRNKVATSHETKVSGGTLSSLSDDDLIKKAAEMEKELTDNSKDVTSHSEDSVAASASLPRLPSRPIDSAQPLPPGLESDYPVYHQSYSTIPLSPKLTLPPPPTYQTRGSSTSYHSYSPRKDTSLAPNFSSSYNPPSTYSTLKSQDDSENPVSGKIKRKFEDDDTNPSKRERMEPSRRNRDSWDNKLPVPVRSRFSTRGRNYNRGDNNQSGFVRSRGNRNFSPRHGWAHSKGEKDFNRRKSSRHDASLRSEWDMHIKEFEEKQRERSREMRYRNRDRERDRQPVSSRSHSTRSSRSREKESGCDSP